MANFKEFRTLLQKHFDEMVKDGAPLFITNADEDKLYNLYWTASRLARILPSVSGVSMIAPAAVVL